MALDRPPKSAAGDGGGAPRSARCARRRARDLPRRRRGGRSAACRSAATCSRSSAAAIGSAVAAFDKTDEHRREPRHRIALGGVRRRLRLSTTTKNFDRISCFGGSFAIRNTMLHARGCVRRDVGNGYRRLLSMALSVAHARGALPISTPRTWAVMKRAMHASAGSRAPAASSPTGLNCTFSTKVSAVSRHRAGPARPSRSARASTRSATPEASAASSASSPSPEMKSVEKEMIDGIADASLASIDDLHASGASPRSPGATRVD